MAKQQALSSGQQMLEDTVRRGVETVASGGANSVMKGEPLPFDILGRAIVIGRERAADRKFVVLALWLEESAGTWRVARHEVLDRSYHRLSAEEKAQLEIVRRKDGDAEPKHRCEWPVGWIASLGGRSGPHAPLPCNRSAIARNKLPLDAATFKAIPAHAVRPHFKLCENHRELLRDTYKLEVEPLA